MDTTLSEKPDAKKAMQGLLQQWQAQEADPKTICQEIDSLVQELLSHKATLGKNPGQNPTLLAIVQTNSIGRPASIQIFPATPEGKKTAIQEGKRHIQALYQEEDSEAGNLQEWHQRFEQFRSFHKDDTYVCLLPITP